MIAVNANILSAPFLKQFSSFLSEDVVGECCRMICHHGRMSTISFVNGGKKDTLNISCKSSSGKYAVREDNKKVHLSEHWTRRVSNGETERASTDLMATRK